jgi:NAD(P)-dependent dehydrogenase (short-subunit alcohol dehydrogenase family)
MKTIVITGSTRGIGYGMAEAFLERGCAVVVSGRSVESVEHALETLAVNHEVERLFGQPCDVTQPAAVRTLWDAAKNRFEKVDIWINNAGVAGLQAKIWAQSPEDFKYVVDTNILGALYGVKVATQGMLEQGFGAIYNLEGMGSDNRIIDGLSIYGMTKRSLTYLTRALAKEAEGTPLVIGGLRPGMVVTDMIMDRYVGREDELKKVKGIFNILCDTVENVAPWLVERILSNRKSGVTISYLSMWKLMGRFLLAPFSKKDLFEWVE